MGESIVRKTFTGVDLDGKEFTETYYFVLTKAEITKKEVSFPGKGYAEYLKEIVATNNKTLIVDAFEDLLLTSVGVKDEATSRLVKEGAAAKFKDSGFFSELFMELLTDAKASAEFFKGVMPKEVSKHLDSVYAETGPKEIATAEPFKKTLLEYNEEELLTMKQDEFDDLLAAHKGNVPKAILQIAMRRPRG